MPSPLDSMSPRDPAHLSQICTDPLVVRWLRDEGELSDEIVVTARRRFFESYADGVYTFLRSLLRDADATDEVVQQFAVRVLERSFRSYSPEKGRFRHYLKTTLRNMVRDHWQRKQRAARFSGRQADETIPDVPEPTSLDTCLSAGDDELEQLLDRTLARLQTVRQQTRPTYAEVLNHAAQYPEQTSQQAAAALTISLKLPKPLSAASLRQSLHRAREKFRELLIEELGAEVGDDADCLDQRLSDLGILDYVRKGRGA